MTDKELKRAMELFPYFDKETIKNLVIMVLEIRKNGLSTISNFNAEMEEDRNDER